MTKLLEKALQEVAELPASEQDAVVAIVLEELASEQRWAESATVRMLPVLQRFSADDPVTDNSVARIRRGINGEVWNTPTLP